MSESEKVPAQGKEMGLGELLKIIREDGPAGERFLKHFPDLRADLITYRADPACKCAHTIRQRIIAAVETLEEFGSEIVGETIRFHGPKHIGGSVATCQSEAEYGQLIARCRQFNWIYQGLSVVPAQANHGQVLKVFFF